MLKREFKINFKSFCIWTGILLLVFGMVFLIYPSIMKSDTISSMNEIMKLFPEELLKAFNMDFIAIDSAFGWLKTEGYIFILLIGGIYSSILGANILLKEESDKTILFLYSMPMRRRDIVHAKIICGITYILLFYLILGSFNFIGLSILGDFDIHSFLLLSVAPIFPSLILFLGSMAISTLFRSSKKMVGISIGIVFLEYFLMMISGISKNVEFLKYFSIYSLSNSRDIFMNLSINPIVYFIFMGISIFFLCIIYIRYQKKEFL